MHVHVHTPHDHCMCGQGCSALLVLPQLKVLLQIQRLLELQSYLNGGVSEWPAPIQEPAVKEEIHVPEPTGNNRPVLNPEASLELFQDIQPEPPQPKSRPPTAAPVSKWTVAEDLDTEQSAIPVSKWVAQEV